MDNAQGYSVFDALEEWLVECKGSATTSNARYIVDVCLNPAQGFHRLADSQIIVSAEIKHNERATATSAPILSALSDFQALLISTPSTLSRYPRALSSIQTP